MPFSGRRMSSPTGRSSSRVWQASTLKLRRMYANTTFSSICANRWPEEQLQWRTRSSNSGCEWTVHGDGSNHKRNLRALTYAVAESSGEGDVCVRRPSHWILRQKALRPELLGLGEVSWVAVESVGNDDGISTLGHLETIYRKERFYCLNFGHSLSWTAGESCEKAPLNLLSVTILPELSSSVIMTDRNDSQNDTNKTPVVRRLHNPSV